MDYEAMLKRGKDKLPEVSASSERFEMPKVKGQLQGNATVISNFGQIAATLDRPKTHLLKYLSKELAVKGVIKKDQFAIFNSKLSASRVNEKVQQYAEQYVLCKDCKKPETQIQRIGQALFIKCNACGQKHPLKRSI
jgi:translation initiation factor 2 subunit 2